MAITTATPAPGFDYTPSYLPLAPGTISSCYYYANYRSDGFEDCIDVANANGITTDELLRWNPSLSSNISTCALQPGYSYCLQQTNAPSKPILISSTLPEMRIYTEN
jgi:hypothetical protein